MEFTKKGLEKERYEGFVKISDIKNYFLKLKEFSNIDVPKKQGVYMILLPNGPNSLNNSIFLDKSKGGHFKNKNPTVNNKILTDNWVNNTEVLYIGKAGGRNIRAKLYRRLKRYMDFGSNKKVGHWGGRYIWQLNNSEDLIVVWKTTPNEKPSEVENKLIKEFINQFGKLPFANLRK